jgi:hypothetical protein
MEEYKGKNGVTFLDNGDTWRAVGSPNVTTPQVIDYVDRDNRPTGVTYGIGVDKLLGQTRISHVDYPKNVWPLDELMSGDMVPKLLMRCNVCHAMDATMKIRSASPPSSVETPSLPVVQSLPPVRMSAGSMASVAPKYLPFIASLGKSLALRPLGDTVLSLGVSVLADILSGVVTDPGYSRALQSLSDGAIDGIAGGNPDKQFFDQVKRDALSIAEARKNDSDFFDALKRGMFKSADEIKKELSVTTDGPQQTSLSSPSFVSGGGNRRSSSFGVDSNRIPRLFE